jgi:hypothetical protein
MMVLTNSLQRYLGVLRVARGHGPKTEAIKSAVGSAVKNCPSSSSRVRPFVVLAVMVLDLCVQVIVKRSRYLSQIFPT